jgi:uncharacterized protein YndB with AHSA1/START domain
MKNRTIVEQISDREFVITRTFDGPPHLVFEAWTKRELFARWWVPKAFAPLLVSCDLDARVGGTYRLVFRHGDAETMAFHGRYLEVVPPSRLVWTNEEGAGGIQITTVTFEETDGKTRVVVHELHPSKEAFDAARGAEEGMVEAFDQLDELLAGAA